MADEPRKRALGVSVPPDESESDRLSREYDARAAEDFRRREARRGEERRRAADVERQREAFQRAVAAAVALEMQQFRAELEAQSSRPAPSSKPKHSALQQWVANLIIAVIAGGGVGAGMAEARKPRATPPEETQRVEREADSQSAGIRAFLKGYVADQQLKEQIDLAWKCSANSGVPPALGVDCPTNVISNGVEVPVCAPKKLTNGKVVAGQPVCKAQLQWPPTRLPP